MVPRDLQEVENLLENVNHLSDGKLSADESQLFSKILAGIKKINHEWSGSVVSGQLVNTIFAEILSTIDFVSANDFSQEAVVDFLKNIVNKVEYITPAQKEQICKIIDSIASMVKNNGGWKIDNVVIVQKLIYDFIVLL